MGGFSFSLALHSVRKDLADEEREMKEERKRNGIESEQRIFSDKEIKIKTLNQFLLKYKQKFSYKGQPNPYLPTRKDVEDQEREETSGGNSGLMIEYDTFFRGKREPAQMIQALKESRENLGGHLKYKRHSLNA